MDGTGAFSARMDPRKIGEIVDVPVAATRNESRRNQVDVAICTLILVESRKKPVLSEPGANRAGAPEWEPEHWHIPTILGRRWQNEAADIQQALKPGLMYVRVIDLPAIDAGNHKRLFFNRHKCANTIGRHQLASTDAALRLIG